MKTKSFAALAIVAALAVGQQAQASFSYSTNLDITSTTGGATFVNNPGTSTATLGGTTVTFTDVSRSGFGVPSVNTINIGNVAVTTSTVEPASNSFTINYTDFITFTNNPPPGFADSQTFALNGVLTVNSVNTGSGVISNMYLAPSSGSFTLGGISFFGAADNFGNPTINGASGNLGGTITAVPEPASIGLLGLGLVGAVGLVRSRRRAA